MLLGSGLRALRLAFPWQALQWAAFVPVSSPNCSFQKIFRKCILIIFTASPRSSHIYPLYAPNFEHLLLFFCLVQFVLPSYFRAWSLPECVAT